jgi:hypothetical protein
MKNIDQNGNKKNELGLNPNLKENPFSVPIDYFHTSKKDILQSIKVIKLTESTFSTPSNYQTQLTQDILTRVSEEKLKSYVHEDGFSVPTGYFNDLSKRIISQAKEPKIVPIKRFKTSWLSYGAAACLALAVSIFTINYQSKPGEAAVETDTSIFASELSNIGVLPTETIISYLAFYPETGDLLVLSDHLTEETDIYPDSFSADEIELYLKNSI